MAASRNASEFEEYPNSRAFLVNASDTSMGTKHLSVSVLLPKPDVVGRLATDAQWAMDSVSGMLDRVKKLALIEFELWLSGRD